MLRKLIKHEFIATARIMWIFYAAMAALSVGAHISFRLVDRLDNGIVQGLMILTIVVWVLSLIACMAGTLVLVVKRFHQNLLTDEGYLMFTLPGSVHHLVLSKLIVSCVWFLASLVAVILAVGVALVDSVLIREFFLGIGELFGNFTALDAAHIALLILELLIVYLVGCGTSMLQFYSAMSIGYGFNSHKGLLSVVSYFVLSYVLQMIGTIVVVAMSGLTPDIFFTIDDRFTPMQIIHGSLLMSLAMEVILGAVFYGITVLNLQKRLNLS